MMTIVVYYAASEQTELYTKWWKIFSESAHDLDYTVIQLTAEDEGRIFGDEVIRYPVDREEIVYSREVCYESFLEHDATPDGEYAFLEPDSRLYRHLPVIPSGFDLVLLSRQTTLKAVPGIRFARKSALPFFRVLREECGKETGSDTMGIPRRRWHGDSRALLRIMGGLSVDYEADSTHVICGVKVKFLSSLLFGVDPEEKELRGGIMKTYKGTHKKSGLNDCLR